MKNLSQTLILASALIAGCESEQPIRDLEKQINQITEHKLTYDTSPIFPDFKSFFREYFSKPQE
jgi:uncharacterized protein YcfL